MAARARERRVDQQAHDDAEWRAEWEVAERESWAYWARTMSLGEALDLLNAEPWGCACVGGLVCCRYRYGTARALQRGAHIAAKLIVSRMEALTNG